MSNKTPFIDNNFDFFPFTNETIKTIKSPADEKAAVTFADSSILQTVSYEAFKRLSFTFTKEHLEHVIKACLSPDASDNDRYVLACVLKNAETSSNGKFPLCQDTGIANIFGWKKSLFITQNLNGKNDYENITEGTKHLYDEKKLRFSTTCPVNFWDEKDPKNNMPAQITIFNENSCLAPMPAFIENTPENSMSFVFCAKGGGSSNKTSFVQGTKATLNKAAMCRFLKEQITHFGTSACPPYTIAVVAGGLSPEQNTLTLKLATAGAYDSMTYEPNPYGFRDKELEDEVKKIASETGYGAQFGGTKFCVDAVVIRLPRHGASCPLSAGVSCSAHRNLKVIVTEKGYYLEKTVSTPSKLPGFDDCMKFLNKNSADSSSEKTINTDNGMTSTLSQLENCKPGDRILLSGKILVARDAAHARWQKLIDEGKPLPDYTTCYPVCYAGPARTPDGQIIGSFGPTTAGRMDSYAESLMSRGAALVTLAKGNRSKTWQDGCKKYKGFYLGTPGGIAAMIASSYIKSQEILDYEDLGMEAVRLVEVENLPCFVITDKNGNDFYEELHG